MLLVDPSLFTAPYDASLSRGLRAAGVAPVWAVRSLRDGEGDAFAPADEVLRFFYPRTDGGCRRTDATAKLLKGVEHVAGLRRLTAEADRRQVAAVHLQWSVLPLLDAAAIRWLRRRRPVILTVHDVEPFNGKQVSFAQRRGFHTVLNTVDRLIVHTEAGRRSLAAIGVPDARIAVVPHGLLDAGPAVRPMVAPDRSTSDRWTVVQFGKIQAYKGIDVLVEALARVPAEMRQRLRVVVAGEALIPIEPLVTRAAALGLTDVLEWRPGYLDDAAVEALLGEADAFVFPYRAIEASGVFLLVAGRGAWIVASALGAFAELIGTDGMAGELVAPGDADALATALAWSIHRRPARRIADAVPDWETIGARTAEVYRAAAVDWRAGKRSGA